MLATLGLSRAAAADPAAQPAPREEVVSDISTREISIQSNFTGIEILIFGSVDFSGAAEPDKDIYDVVVVLRSPDQAVVARRKERMAGIWVNGTGKIYPTVPGFYAVLSSRPLRAITSDETLKTLGIGLNNIDFGRVTKSGPDEETFRSTVIRLKEQQLLFQEHDDGVAFIGRSLFRASVDLPVNVPIGRYTADVYLFRDGQVVSKNQSTLEVTQAGLERAIYLTAFNRPLIYGLVAVLLAVLAGLAGWAAFRRRIDRTVALSHGVTLSFHVLGATLYQSNAACRSHAFAGQPAGLLHPGGELSFVDLVVLVDVEVAHVLLLGRAGRNRTQRRAAEERHLDVLREAMEAEEPALALDAIEGRVPFDRLVHAGDGAHDERVEAAPDVALPARHGRDVGLHGGVAVALRDLRIAA